MQGHLYGAAAVLNYLGDRLAEYSAKQSICKYVFNV